MIYENKRVIRNIKKKTNLIILRKEKKADKPVMPTRAFIGLVIVAQNVTTATLSFLRLRKKTTIQLERC
jgi:hypothetical protein